MMNVKKLLGITQLLVNMKELTLEQNHINVLNVENPSAGAPTLLPTRELIQERNPISVMNVEKPSVGVQILHGIRELIREENMGPFIMINSSVVIR